MVSHKVSPRSMPLAYAPVPFGIRIGHKPREEKTKYIYIPEREYDGLNRWLRIFQALTALLTLFHPVWNTVFAPDKSSVPNPYAPPESVQFPEPTLNPQNLAWAYDPWFSPEQLAQRNIQGAALKQAAGTGTLLPGHWEQVARYAKPAVVALLAKGSNTIIGAGIIVDGKKGLVLSNFHMFKNQGPWDIMLLNGKRAPAQLLALDVTDDIALVQVKPETLGLETLPELALAEALPKPAAQTLAVGHGAGFPWSVTGGIVAANDRFNANKARFIQFDTAISGGNSGGGLLNMAGEIIAMPTFRHTGGNVENTNSGVSAERLRQALQEWAHLIR